MTIAYLSASSERHTSESVSAVTSNTFTAAGWLNTRNATTGQLILSCADGASSSYFNLSISSGNVNCQPNDALATKSGVTANAWHHAAAKSVSITSCFAYLNGVAGAESTTNAGSTFSTMDWTTIGAQHRNGPTTNAFFDGELAHMAVWSVALSDALIASLAAGAHPLSVEPESLVGYWPLRGDGPVGTRARDSIGSIPLGIVGGTPTKAESPTLVRNCFMQGVG